MMNKQSKYFYLILGNMEVAKILGNLNKLGINIPSDKISQAISILLNNYVYPRIISGKMITKNLMYDFMAKIALNLNVVSSKELNEYQEFVSDIMDEKGVEEKHHLKKLPEIMKEVSDRWEKEASILKIGNVKVQVPLDPMIIQKMKKILSEEIVSDDISDDETINALNKVTDDFIIRALAYFPSVDITTDSIVEDLANEVSLEMVKSSKCSGEKCSECDDCEDKISKCLDEAIKNSSIEK